MSTTISFSKWWCKLQLEQDINPTCGILGRLEQAKQSKGPSDLEDSCHKVMQVLGSLTKFLQNHPHLVQVAARDIANTIAHIYVGKSYSYSFLLLWF